MTNTTSAAYGASPAEWAHFSTHLGFTADLLPVVSNPKAEISPKSKMAGVGKTPSRYNPDRKVVGIPAWTEHKATAAEVERWQRDGDLGICLQTREVRAIDIDIDDQALATRVLDAINLIVGDLPVRMRKNSGKCLLAFRMPGEFTKRILRTEQGIIEFLANGQQFIAVGTHPSGARYEWQGGLPEVVPYLTRDDFEGLWAAIEAAFAISGTVSRGPGAKPTVKREAGEVDDQVLAFLERTGWVRSFDQQGRAHITCPWEAEHSDGKEGAESATTYFPAGVGGFAQGHFRCLHAHCEHRTDGDFLEATGYGADGFEVVVPKPGESALPPVLPKFTRDKRTNKILATVGNLIMAMRADVCGWHIAFDTFNAELMRAPFGTTEWVKFTDADYVRLRQRLTAGGFEEVGREVIRDVVMLAADENKFDSAQVWLKNITPKWDGVERVRHFWHRYFKTADNAYTRAAGEYAWTALAGRVLSPGCQVDMVPVLVGKQGTRKTSGVKAMAPSKETFVELSMDIHDIDLARKMRGKLVGELGELRGLAGKDSDAIKQWITRSTEEWTPKYKEFGTTFERRLLMVGTTNRDEILVDDDGEERRWLPMRVLGLVDVDAIVRDREQLWAEGAVLFARNGVVFDDAEELAKGVHAEFRASDPWHNAISHWLDDTEFGDAQDAPPRRHGVFKITDLMQSALNLDVRHLERKHEIRVSKILRVMGFANIQLRSASGKIRYWVLAENYASAQTILNNSFGDIA